MYFDDGRKELQFVTSWVNNSTQLNSTGQFNDHSARFAVVAELAS